MKVHNLKTWPEHYNNVVNGTKTFEIRKDDRDIEVGHVVVLEEYDKDLLNKEGRITGRKCAFFVSHKLTGGQFGLQEGYCILSFNHVQIL